MSKITKPNTLADIKYYIKEYEKLLTYLKGEDHDLNDYDDNIKIIKYDDYFEFIYNENIIFKMYVRMNNGNRYLADTMEFVRSSYKAKTKVIIDDADFDLLQNAINHYACAKIPMEQL